MKNKKQANDRKIIYLILENRKMEKREWGSKLNSFQSFEKVACI